MPLFLYLLPSNSSNMKQISVFLILTSLLFTFSQCKTMKSEDQGIQGQVTWLEGNQMPMISESGKDSNSPSTPAKRTIRVYPLINLADAKMVDGLFQSLAEEPIGEFETDEEGNFSISLSPGNYSVFTVEEDGLFANTFDGAGNIQPIKVENGTWAKLDILINYKAAY